MNGEYAALATRIEAKLYDVELVVQRAQHQLNLAIANNDHAYLDGVALNLHGFYAGVETIFEDIARAVDDHVPTGPDWHRSLLLQMSGKTQALRPAVIRPNTRICLDEYRRFRHVVRNVYTFNLRPSRIQELTEELQTCFDELKQDFATFRQFLYELANDD